LAIFREIPPTAGFPLYAKDFLSVFTLKERRNCLEDDFSHYLNLESARVTYSGTAAFYLILESLKELSKRKTVIIPSFVCPLIPLAIKRAGLNVELCDINKDDFSFDAEMLEALCRANTDVLAIVAVHLAGIPVDFDVVENIAKKYSVFTIEDCAQSLGASYKGEKVGTRGDFSFFSLCRGKGLTMYEGGIAATGNKEYAELLDRTIQRVVRNNLFSEMAMIVKLFGYAVFYRPLLFWFVFRLPQLFWIWRGDTIKAAMEKFDLDFPIHRVSTVRQLIGHSQFSRLDEEARKQRLKALFYIKCLEDIKGIKSICEPQDSIATYPFVTLIFDDPRKRAQALRALEESGHGGSFVYALAIADYGYLKDIVPDRNCANARHISKRTVTLSTSTFLEEADARSVVKLLKGL
jgi:perosamine synthetase